MLSISLTIEPPSSIMIKKRLKNKFRKLAVKLFDMEFDVQERPPRPDFTPEVDAAKIPKIVDGSGDTPGPNHKSEIGRTWLSAQVTSDVHPLCIDVRPPNEVVSGIIPGARLMPGWTIREKLEVLPDKTEKVVIYDQTGEANSGEIASFLREQGWNGARQLSGGIAEWIEYGELIETLTPTNTLQIGDVVYLDQERTETGYIFNIGEHQLELWSPQKGYLGQYAISSIFS